MINRPFLKNLNEERAKIGPAAWKSIYTYGRAEKYSASPGVEIFLFLATASASASATAPQNDRACDPAAAWKVYSYIDARVAVFLVLLVSSPSLLYIVKSESLIIHHFELYHQMTYVFFTFFEENRLKGGAHRRAGTELRKNQKLKNSTCWPCPPGRLGGDRIGHSKSRTNFHFSGKFIFSSSSPQIASSLLIRPYI